MIAFIAPLLLKLSPVGRILKSIPRQVWIAIAIAAVIGLGWWLHAHSVKKAYRTGYSAGVAAEGARIAKKAAEIKAKADALTGKISTELRKRHDEKVIVINRAADDLRVRGPGKASCPGYPGIPSSPSRSEPANGQGNAAGPQVPAGDIAAVPWGWLVDRAEQCDLNRQEVLSWREWHAKQSEAWKQIR